MSGSYFSKSSIVLSGTLLAGGGTYYAYDQGFINHMFGSTENFRSYVGLGARDPLEMVTSADGKTTVSRGREPATVVYNGVERPVASLTQDEIAAVPVDVRSNFGISEAAGGSYIEESLTVMSDELASNIARDVNGAVQRENRPQDPSQSRHGEAIPRDETEQAKALALEQRARIEAQRKERAEKYGFFTERNGRIYRTDMETGQAIIPRPIGTSSGPSGGTQLSTSGGSKGKSGSGGSSGPTVSTAPREPASQNGYPVSTSSFLGLPQMGSTFAAGNSIVQNNAGNAFNQRPVPQGYVDHVKSICGNLSYAECKRRAGSPDAPVMAHESRSAGGQSGARNFAANEVSPNPNPVTTAPPSPATREENRPPKHGTKDTTGPSGRDEVNRAVREEIGASGSDNRADIGVGKRPEPVNEVEEKAEDQNAVNKAKARDCSKEFLKKKSDEYDTDADSDPFQRERNLPEGVEETMRSVGNRGMDEREQKYKAYRDQLHSSVNNYCSTLMATRRSLKTTPDELSSMGLENYSSAQAAFEDLGFSQRDIDDLRENYNNERGTALAYMQSQSSERSQILHKLLSHELNKYDQAEARKSPAMIEADNRIFLRCRLEEQLPGSYLNAELATTAANPECAFAGEDFTQDDQCTELKRPLNSKDGLHIVDRERIMHIDSQARDLVQVDSSLEARAVYPAGVDPMEAETWEMCSSAGVLQGWSRVVTALHSDIYGNLPAEKTSNHLMAKNLFTCTGPNQWGSVIKKFEEDLRPAAKICAIPEADQMDKIVKDPQKRNEVFCGDATKRWDAMNRHFTVGTADQPICWKDPQSDSTASYAQAEEVRLHIARIKENSTLGKVEAGAFGNCQTIRQQYLYYLALVTDVNSQVYAKSVDSKVCLGHTSGPTNGSSKENHESGSARPPSDTDNTRR